MLAAEIQADLLILMSDVNGIYTKAPWEEGAKMIWTYTSEMRDTVQFGQKSKVGTGGMDSKVSYAIKTPVCKHPLIRTVTLTSGKFQHNMA